MEKKEMQVGCDRRIGGNGREGRMNRIKTLKEMKKVMREQS